MERIHVSVRARPLSAEDAKTSPWRISANSICTVNQSASFAFDRIFGEECKTREVYEAKTKQLVSAAVAGFNGTVFAYGQTNSGKTHTMRGSVSEAGVIPLAVHDLFHIIQEDMDREFLLRMSYMEIYNEEINDLLVPEHRKLQIHESLERGIFVAGLREEIVTCPEQVLNFMEFGESHRHIGETNMNVYSSRSHTIFRMIIESRDRVEDGDSSNVCDAVRVSVLNLVDLAGSERAAKTGAEGVRLKEGSHINKSLMTLGTVIKKLSEGVESQGGHVPYRDSKLTRILQPALGGNANTAIICNITLAQIHADETKSSLQFASRALHVTNCARVNEILTDAALLKRQKKEIEELRAKLLDSNSEHFEEEILNLRNTLLQSELEKERIALELQAEKKAQAQRDKRLQEQAKKIANLSSMILNTKKDDIDIENQQKMIQRRKTWCPIPLSRETHDAVVPIGQDTIIESAKAARDTALNLPFEELVDESKDDWDPINECNIPDTNLRNITNRRKVLSKKKSSISVNSDLTEMQAEYEKLLVKFETELTTKDIEIECLKKGLAKSEQFTDMSTVPHPRNSPPGIKSLTSRESEAIYVIKQLQEQIETLEREKSSVQATLDSVVELATEQNRSACEKFDKVNQELLDAHEEVRLATEQLCCLTSSEMSEEADVNSSTNLVSEVQGIALELRQSRDAVDCLFSVVDELFLNFSIILNMFKDLKSSVNQSLVILKSVHCDQVNTHNCMKAKITQFEFEKDIFHNQLSSHLRQIRELELDLQNSEKSLVELTKEKEREIEELAAQSQSFHKEISYLSTSSLAREREALRKDLEKTKTKLKDTESKLKNSIQDKIKLKSEKATAEREIKFLQSQMSLLERDISKRDSLADKRQESLTRVASSMHEHNLQLKVMELDKTKLDLEILSGEYQSLEASAFEMEENIVSLEKQLQVEGREKEEASASIEILSSDLESMSNELISRKLELTKLREEVSMLTLMLEKSSGLSQELESSVTLLSKEKEELAMQLTDALLELEETKAVLSAKEGALISMSEKLKSCEAEILSLSKDLSEARHEMKCCREKCMVLSEKLSLSEENVAHEKKCSIERAMEIADLMNVLRVSENERHKCEEVLSSEVLTLKTKQELLHAENEKLKGIIVEANIKKKSQEPDTSETNKEKARLRLMLRSTQAKLQAAAGRYRETVEENNLMDKKFKLASKDLKEKLETALKENLDLKKVLSSHH